MTWRSLLQRWFVGLDVDLMTARVLFVTHDGFDSALVHSQFLPVARELARRGLRVSVLGFEPKPSMESEALFTRVVVLPRRSGGLIFKSGADIYRLIATMRRELREHDVLVCRSYIPTLAAVLARGLKRSPVVVFDMRGLMPDEYVESGYWRAGGLKHRIALLVERLLCVRSDSVLVTTESFRSLVLKRNPGLASSKVVVGTNGTDVASFEYDPGARMRARELLGIPRDARVLVFLGSGASWHMPAETARLCAIAQSRDAGAWVVWSTYEAAERAAETLASSGCDMRRVIVGSWNRREVQSMLAAGDVGLLLLAATPSKRIAVPVKLGEYLAAGLRIVSGGTCDEVNAACSRGAGVSAFVDSESLADSALGLAVSGGDYGARANVRRMAEQHYDRGLQTEAYMRIIDGLGLNDW